VSWILAMFCIFKCCVRKVVSFLGVLVRERDSLEADSLTCKVQMLLMSWLRYKQNEMK